MANQYVQPIEGRRMKGAGRNMCCGKRFISSSYLCFPQVFVTWLCEFKEKKQQQKASSPADQACMTFKGRFTFMSWLFWNVFCRLWLPLVVKTLKAQNKHLHMKKIKMEILTNNKYPFWNEETDSILWSKISSLCYFHIFLRYQWTVVGCWCLASSSWSTLGFG